MPHQDGTQLHRIFLQAPAAIAILEGPDQKFVLANEKYLQLYNRTWKQVYNKTLIEVFPELQDQKINEQFKKVYTTGELFSDSEFLSIWNDESDERQVYEGTGIRLAIVKKTVQNHHGFITATGKENTGATFDIYLPVN